MFVHFFGLKLNVCHPVVWLLCAPLGLAPACALFAFGGFVCVVRFKYFYVIAIICVWWWTLLRHEMCDVVVLEEFLKGSGVCCDLEFRFFDGVGEVYVYWK